MRYKMNIKSFDTIGVDAIRVNTYGNGKGAYGCVQCAPRHVCGGDKGERLNTRESRALWIILLLRVATEGPSLHGMAPPLFTCSVQRCVCVCVYTGVCS